MHPPFLNERRLGPCPYFSRIQLDLQHATCSQLRALYLPRPQIRRRVLSSREFTKTGTELPFSQLVCAKPRRHCRPVKAGHGKDPYKVAQQANSPSQMRAGHLRHVRNAPLLDGQRYRVRADVQQVVHGTRPMGPGSVSRVGAGCSARDGGGHQLRRGHDSASSTFKIINARLRRFAFPCLDVNSRLPDSWRACDQILITGGSR